MRKGWFGFVGVLASCSSVTPALHTYTQLRPETRSECEAHCQLLGMRLGAVVLIQDSAGCVCEPAEGEASPRAGAAAVAGGEMVARARAEAEQRDANAAQMQSILPPAVVVPGPPPVLP